ncbi:unnamed protein product [Closterium sp. NIES-64]|nr:unnamed protein product [Closterium sp. NIES-64]
MLNHSPATAPRNNGTVADALTQLIRSKNPAGTRGQIHCDTTTSAGTSSDNQLNRRTRIDDLKKGRARIDSLAALGSASAAQQVVSGSAGAARRASTRRADGLPTADPPAAAALDAVRLAREPLGPPCHLAARCPPLPHALVFAFPSAASLQPASRGWERAGVAQPGVVEALKKIQQRRWGSEGTAGVAPVAPALRAESSEPLDPPPCSALDCEYPRHATCSAASTSAAPQQAVVPPIPPPHSPPLAAFPHCLAQVARAHRSAHPRWVGMGAAGRGDADEKAGTIARVLQQLAERRAAQLGQAEEDSKEGRAGRGQACGTVTAGQGGEGGDDSNNGSDVLDEPISTLQVPAAAAAMGARAESRVAGGEDASEALVDAWLACPPEPPGTSMPAAAASPRAGSGGVQSVRWAQGLQQVKLAGDGRDWGRHVGAAAIAVTSMWGGGGRQAKG